MLCLQHVKIIKSQRSPLCLFLKNIHTIINKSCRNNLLRSTQSNAWQNAFVRRGFSTDSYTKIIAYWKKFKSQAYEKSVIFVPVHLISTSFWFAGFYIFCDGGLACLNVKGSEKFKEYLNGNKWGRLAIIFVLMKVATPIRFAVSIGTTVYISKLLKRVKLSTKS